MTTGPWTPVMLPFPLTPLEVWRQGCWERRGRTLETASWWWSNQATAAWWSATWSNSLFDRWEERYRTLNIPLGKNPTLRWKRRLSCPACCRQGLARDFVGRRRSARWQTDSCVCHRGSISCSSYRWLTSGRRTTRTLVHHCPRWRGWGWMCPTGSAGRRTASSADWCTESTVWGVK